MNFIALIISFQLEALPVKKLQARDLTATLLGTPLAKSTLGANAGLLTDERSVPAQTTTEGRIKIITGGDEIGNDSDVLLATPVNNRLDLLKNGDVLGLVGDLLTAVTYLLGHLSNPNKRKKVVGVPFTKYKDDEPTRIIEVEKAGNGAEYKPDAYVPPPPQPNVADPDAQVKAAVLPNTPIGI